MGAALAGLAFRGFQGLSAANLATDTRSVASTDDGVNDSFDAEGDPTEDVAETRDAKANPEAGIASARPAPATPAAEDDARDFFDGKKG